MRMQSLAHHLHYLIALCLMWPQHPAQPQLQANSPTCLVLTTLPTTTSSMNSTESTMEFQLTSHLHRLPCHLSTPTVTVTWITDCPMTLKLPTFPTTEELWSNTRCMKDITTTILTQELPSGRVPECQLKPSLPNSLSHTSPHVTSTSHNPEHFFQIHQTIKFPTIKFQLSLTKITVQ